MPARFIPNRHALRIRLSVNGVLKQDDTTAGMTFDITRQIEFLSGYAKVLPR